MTGDAQGTTGRDLSDVAWRKSSLSTPQHNCVEVAFPGPDTVAVRDSKDPGALLHRGRRSVYGNGCHHDP
jgi:hypothetical protein